MSMFKVMTDSVKNPFLMLIIDTIVIKLASQVANVMPILLMSDFIKLKCPLTTRPNGSSKDLGYFVKYYCIITVGGTICHFMSFL